MFLVEGDVLERTVESITFGCFFEDVLTARSSSMRFLELACAFLLRRVQPVTWVSASTGGMPSTLDGPEIGVFANVCRCHQQLKTHFFTAVPAIRKLFAHEERRLVTRAMLVMHDKIEPRLGSSLARLVGLFRHRFLPTNDRPPSRLPVFGRLLVTKGGAATYDT